MSGDGFAEVFDFECSFKAAGEKAAKGCDEGGEGCEDEDVELHGDDVNGRWNVKVGGQGDVGDERGYVVGLGDEDGIGSAFKTGKDVCAKVLRWSAQEQGADMEPETYIDWAGEVLVAHQYVDHGEAKNDSADPGSNEALDGLFWRKLNKLSTAEGYTADIGEDVVGDDE